MSQAHNCTAKYIPQFVFIKESSVFGPEIDFVKKIVAGVLIEANNLMQGRILFDERLGVVLYETKYVIMVERSLGLQSVNNVFELADVVRNDLFHENKGRGADVNEHGLVRVRQFLVNEELVQELECTGIQSHFR